MQRSGKGLSTFKRELKISKTKLRIMTHIQSVEYEGSVGIEAKEGESVIGNCLVRAGSLSQH